LVEGIAKVTSGQTDFDLFFGVQIYTLGRLIAGGFLQPLNLDYVPNIAANVWDQLPAPSTYESRHTVPAAISNTASWRNDFVTAHRRAPLRRLRPTRP
jgi:hypothetical protein